MFKTTPIAGEKHQTRDSKQIEPIRAHCTKGKLQSRNAPGPDWFEEGGFFKSKFLDN